jgi:hypothetical protein
MKIEQTGVKKFSVLEDPSFKNTYAHYCPVPIKIALDRLLPSYYFHSVIRAMFYVAL